MRLNEHFNVVEFKKPSRRMKRGYESWYKLSGRNRC